MAMPFNGISGSCCEIRASAMYGLHLTMSALMPLSALGHCSTYT